MKYFWHYSPETTPKPVVQPRDCPTAADRLCVSCTQTGLSGAQQKKLVDAWCALLPTLATVRFLWLTSKVPQRLFEAACGMRGLEGLWIKWSSIVSIDAIGALLLLQHFHLGSSTQLSSIEPLRDRTGVKSLGLENLAKVRRLDPLATLRDLDQLSLEGGMWSPWKVESLSPIGELTELKYLSLANLRADDGTLAPLYGLQKLESLTTAKWWEESELAEIHRRNPGLRR